MSDYYEMIIARGGGMITCGQHLGVMVAPGKDLFGEFIKPDRFVDYEGCLELARANGFTEKKCACPPGWCFVPLEIATVDLIAQAVEHVKRGRDKWPMKPTQGKKSEDQLLAEVFDSQDYIEGG